MENEEKTVKVWKSHGKYFDENITRDYYHEIFAYYLNIHDFIKYSRNIHEIPANWNIPAIFTAK